MLKLMTGLSGNIIGVSGTGKISGLDYETVLIPEVEAKLKTNKKIRFLYYLEDDFIGFDLKAMFDDAKLGFKHLSAWEKIALVSDHKIINAFADFFGSMLSCEIGIFKNSELEDAKKWITKN